MNIATAAPPDAVCLLPALELARVLRARELSARELLELFLARIDRVNPSLNALVALDVERARAAAEESDRRLLQREPRGLLEGLPITVKDVFETERLRTTAGAVELANHVPHQDAVAVGRLRGAGAIIFGKSNTPRFADGAQTFNDVFGRTNNPWDLSRTPGGSSGGAAAAVAAGLTAFELGSDIGGSLRHPADWCGIFAHKPTFGLVPMLGHIPPSPGSVSVADLAVAGPLARSAADLELVLRVLAGPHGREATAYRLALPQPRLDTLAGARVAVWLDDPACPIDFSVRDRLESVVALMMGAGACVEQVPPPINMAELGELFIQLFTGAAAASQPDTVFKSLESLAALGNPDDPDIALRFARGVTQSHRAWLRSNARRQQLRHDLATFFERYDVLVTPVGPVQAFHHDPRSDLKLTISVNGAVRPAVDLLPWTALANVAYLPSTVVPTGSVNNLPVGLQVMSAEYADRTTIAIGTATAELTGGFQVPPLLSAG